METKKRLLININEEFHADIKSRAAKKRISLTTYVLEALAKVILDEQKQGNKEEK